MRAARTVIVFGVYLMVAGVVLVVAPNALLRPIGFEPTTEPWVRIIGGISIALGYYYLQAGRQGVEAFIRWTARSRPAMCAFFIVLALLRLAKPQLVLFGVIDLAGAIWTTLALRADAAPGVVLTPEK